MQIYHYDEKGFFLRASMARLDPRDPSKSFYLIPRNATEIAPPEVTGYERARWIANHWEAVLDCRAAPYFILPDRSPRFIENYGEDFPPGAIFELPPLTDEEKMEVLVTAHRRTIVINTMSVIEDFTFNSKQYSLTPSVLAQLSEINALISIADDPLIYFPVDVVLGEVDGVEDVQTVNNPATFKAAVVAVMEHVKDKRAEARALKVSLDTLTLTELEAWEDPRI